MATKPTNTYRWAQESGGTKHNIVEPSSGHKDEGWIPGRGAIAQFFNWLGNGAHEWILYLRDAVFVGEAGQPGVTATGGTGATAGGVFTGGPGGGAGLTATGVAAGPAATFVGGASGAGINVSAASAGLTVNATSTGSGDCGRFDASSGTGYAIVGVGNSTRATLRITPQSAQPSSPQKGDIYYDSDTDTLHLYDGAWKTFTVV